MADASREPDTSGSRCDRERSDTNGAGHGRNGISSRLRRRGSEPAHIQKMIAGQLRQEAARLAHDTMSLKRASVFTRESRSKVQEMNR